MSATDRFVVGVPLGRWQTNCYVVGDRERGTCAIIDPGETGAEHLPGLLDQAGVTCEAILLTHGHIDHIWAVPDLAARLDVPVYLHPDDRWLWDDPAAGFGMPTEVIAAQLGLSWDPPSDRLTDLAGDRDITVAGIDFRVKHNPGHTPGHVTFLGRGLDRASIRFALGSAEQGSDDVLFSGDLVFAGSIGRTDFPRGSTADMMRSLVDTVLPLEDDTLILSGHGTDTTVGRERATNPFLAQAAEAHS